MLSSYENSLSQLEKTLHMKRYLLVVDAVVMWPETKDTREMGAKTW